ncbi:hypothetical protein KKE60_05865 [Patescibacteria group bacterium]|nr:hypothetical protein [Patescibacteria group bacterium]
MVSSYSDFRALDPSKYIDNVSPGRAATIVVAASNSSLQSKAQADRLCSGVADDVEIQAAIDALPAGGGKIGLTEGTFNLSHCVYIRNDDISLEGYGEATYLHNPTAGAIYATADNATVIKIAGVAHGSAGDFTTGDLTVDAPAAQPDCTVQDASVFSIGDVVEIWDSANRETNTIANVVGNVVTMLNNLANNYTVINKGCVRKGCSLTIDANFQDLTVTVADGSIFSAGDRCLISEAIGAQLNRKTTPIIIKSVLGNVLTTYYSLPPKYQAAVTADPNWLVANGAFVVIMTTVKGVTVEKLTAQSDNTFPVWAVYAEDFNIRNIKAIAGVYQHTIEPMYSIYGKVINNITYGGKMAPAYTSHSVIKDNIVDAGTIEFCIETYHGSNHNTIVNNQVRNAAATPFKLRGYKNVVIGNTIETDHVFAAGMQLTGAIEGVYIGNVMPGLSFEIGANSYNNIVSGNIAKSVYETGLSHDNLFYTGKIDLFMDVLAVSATHVRSNEDLSAGVSITFTIDAQPDVPRTLSGHFDTHAQITAYTIVITGVDAKGRIITETFTEAVSPWDFETVNAFATITSIKMTARTGTGAGDTMDIGITDVLGLSNKIAATTDVYKIKKNNANALVAVAQVNDTYDTYDMAVIGLAVGDDFTIYFKSPLNLIS